ncbi:MAG: PucR family transcriptional regulator [Clostridia bacterium]|nr:PucR family transcriptional regulator [Clostridia bacterium]
MSLYGNNTRKGCVYLVSNKLFQSVIQQMKESTDRTIGIIDESAVVVACNDLSMIGQSLGSSITDIMSMSDVSVVNGYTYRVIGSRIKLDNVVFVKGTDHMAESLSGVLSVAFNTMKDFYDEKYDKTNFIKNVMLENILPGDIYAKSKELHFTGEVPRVVILIRLLDRTEIFAYDIIQSLFPEKTKDFIINVGENDIALVKEVKPTIEIKDLEKLSRSIVDTLNSEFYTRAVIGIGTIVTTLRDLARSFKEAQVAIEVGKVFDVEKVIMSYNTLGIGRLIYYLPTTLCNMFLSEVFKKGSIDSLDHETLFTIQKFFENNLNVSETSRKLFVHRNTLVYRLEKIRRLTGLDLKEFDHAIIFKVALMVRKYLSSNPTKF